MRDSTKYKYTASIRGQFLITAIVLIIAVIAVTVFAQRQNNVLERKTTENILARNALLDESRHIRDAVWRARETLNLFLLDPYKTELKDSIYIALSDALAHAKALSDQKWIVAKNKTEIVAQLNAMLSKLDGSTRELIETRLNASKQYPSLYLASTVLNPLHRESFANLSLAMEELENSEPSRQNFRIYALVVKTRIAWSEVISNFRMYLANRMGSFDINTLAVQERDIDLLYESVSNNLKKLVDLDKAGRLDFQTSITVQQIVPALKAWHEGFQKTIQINNSVEWRADGKLIKQNLAPAIDSVWKILIELDQSLEQSSVEDVNTMASMATTQTKLLWLFTTLGVFAIVLIFLVLDRILLKPLESVAIALHSEATGAPVTELPRSNVVEIKYLLDAFFQMRKQVNQRQVALEHQATHDTLTGLPNRSLLADRIQHAVQKSVRSKKPMAFMMLDLDRFKEVNDTLGHQVGDKLLTTLGSRLGNLLRKADTVARLGGDEFGILLEDTTAEQAGIVARKIITTVFEVPVEIDSHTLFLSGSIGIALFPEHGENPEILLQHGDVAMYVAKQNRLGYTYYDPAIDKHTVGRLALMTDLRNAIASETLSLHFQPKLSLTTRKVTGAEALLRWLHPERGMVPPDQVIPVAEQTGLIRPLTLWVLDKAIGQGKRWLTEGIELNVAVNISAYNLQDADFEAEVKDRLQHYDYPPSLLTLEVTESAMMSNANKAAETLQHLDKLGVRISIDDYGTGFSSLAYLKQLPVDELKIDKTFVFGMLTSENEAIIVQSTIELAHNLGLKIVAEGIESKAVLHKLAEWGCDIGQGYHIARPMPATELVQWLQSDHYTALANGATDKN